MGSSFFPVGKIAEKAVRGSVFLTMALYFECRINKKRTPSDCFFSDFAHWVKAEPYLWEGGDGLVCLQATKYHY